MCCRGFFYFFSSLCLEIWSQSGVSLESLESLTGVLSLEVLRQDTETSADRRADTEEQTQSREKEKYMVYGYFLIIILKS